MVVPFFNIKWSHSASYSDTTYNQHLLSLFTFTTNESFKMSMGMRNILFLNFLQGKSPLRLFPLRGIGVIIENGF